MQQNKHLFAEVLFSSTCPGYYMNAFYMTAVMDNCLELESF